MWALELWDALEEDEDGRDKFNKMVGVGPNESEIHDDEPKLKKPMWTKYPFIMETCSRICIN